MIIIETCPKCGHDLQDEVICTYPPIPRKVCWNCGWNWTGEPEKITRVPFGDNTDTLINKDSIPLSWNGTSTGWDSTNLATSSTITAFGTKACENCPSKPEEWWRWHLFLHLGID